MGNNTSIKKRDNRLKNVKIGDIFMSGTKTRAVVVDFHVVTSMKTGKFVDYKCIAQGVNTMAKNEFEVPFATVVRNRIECDCTCTKTNSLWNKMKAGERCSSCQGLINYKP